MSLTNPNSLVVVSQLNTVAQDIATKADSRFLKQADVVSYTIKKQAEADTGYASTYQLFTVGTGTGGTDEAVGAKINIAKDQFVQSGTVETVATADVPYQGAQVGDKYVDLVLANAESSHIYIPVNDLVDVYTAGQAIEISNNEITVKIDSSNANGLSKSANGLALGTVTASTSGVGGTNGAMLATDKEKLDNADVTAYTGTGAVSVSNHVISVGAAQASTSGEGGAAGTMSATDKEKLDNADVTAYTGTGAISVSSHQISVAAASASTAGVGGNAGTISATDQEKLDGMVLATSSDITEITGAIWPAA